MNLGELRTSFLARGFDYLDASGTTRQDQFINDSYLNDLAEPYPWPDLEATSSSLTIPDLKDVIHVLDATNDRQLSHADSRYLTDLDPDYATTAGAAAFWYLTDDGVIATYPTDSSATYSVRYLRVPTVLSTANDEPILPARLHSLIVDYAVVRGLIDRDNYTAAGQLKQWADMQLEKLAGSILWATSDPNRITIAAGSGDW